MMAKLPAFAALTGLIVHGLTGATLYIEPRFDSPRVVELPLPDGRVRPSSDVPLDVPDGWQGAVYAGTWYGYVSTSMLRESDGQPRAGARVYLEPNSQRPPLVTILENTPVTVRQRNEWWAQVELSVPLYVYFVPEDAPVEERRSLAWFNPFGNSSKTEAPPAKPVRKPEPQKVTVTVDGVEKQIAPGQSIGYNPRGVAEEIEAMRAKEAAATNDGTMRTPRAPDGSGPVVNVNPNAPAKPAPTATPATTRSDDWFVLPAEPTPAKPAPVEPTVLKPLPPTPAPQVEEFSRSTRVETTRVETPAPEPVVISEPVGDPPPVLEPVVLDVPPPAPVTRVTPAEPPPAATPVVKPAPMAAPRRPQVVEVEPTPVLAPVSSPADEESYDDLPPTVVEVQTRPAKPLAAPNEPTNLRMAPPPVPPESRWTDEDLQAIPAEETVTIVTPGLTWRPPAATTPASPVPQTYSGYLMRTKRPWYSLQAPRYPYELVDAEGNRLAYLDVSHSLTAAPVEGYVGTPVQVHGTWEPGKDGTSAVIRARNLRQIAQ